MDLDFTKVTYDGELSDFSEDELRETIREFETAQESNVAEFETAAEAIDGVEDADIEDFEDAREALIEDITEAEAFDEVPLSEDKLENEDFSDLQEWKSFVLGSSEESDEGEDEGDFDDFGQKVPTHDPDDTKFADEQVDSIPGVTLSE